MLKNYIILAHENPYQLRRLINRLDDGHSYFFVHIDKKSNIDEFRKAIQLDCVVFVGKRVECTWGHFSLVQATINSIEEVIDQNRTGYTILLSGQSYPLVNNETLNNYLLENKEYDFIDAEPVEEVWEQYHKRIDLYRINFSRKRGDYILLKPVWKSSIREILNVVIKIVRRRKFSTLLTLYKLFHERNSGLIKHYGGSQWWAFRHETLKKVHRFIKNNKAFVDYHQDTMVPDEILFQSIIGYLENTDNEIKIKKSITYVKWEPDNRSSPALFNKLDYEELKSQIVNEKLFARKFDSHHDSEILDKLDRSASNVFEPAPDAEFAFP